MITLHTIISDDPAYLSSYFCFFYRWSYFSLTTNVSTDSLFIIWQKKMFVSFLFPYWMFYMALQSHPVFDSYLWFTSSVVCHCFINGRALIVVFLNPHSQQWILNSGVQEFLSSRFTISPQPLTSFLCYTFISLFYAIIVSYYDSPRNLQNSSQHSQFHFYKVCLNLVQSIATLTCFIVMYNTQNMWPFYNVFVGVLWAS